MADGDTMEPDWKNNVTECVQSHVATCHEKEIPLQSRYATDIHTSLQNTIGNRKDDVIVTLAGDSHKPKLIIAGQKEEVHAAAERVNKASETELNSVKLRHTQTSCQVSHILFIIMS